MEKSLTELEEEYENIIFLASTLTYDHQKTAMHDLLNKAESIKELIFEKEKSIKENYKQLMKGFK